VRGEDSSRRSFGRPRGNLPAHPPPQGGQTPRAGLTAISLPSGLTLRVAPEYGIALCCRDPAHGQVTPSGADACAAPGAFVRVPFSSLTGRMRAASLQSGSQSFTRAHARSPTRAHAGQISPIRVSVTHPGPCGPRLSNPGFLEGTVGHPRTKLCHPIRLFSPIGHSAKRLGVVRAPIGSLSTPNNRSGVGPAPNNPGRGARPGGSGFCCGMEWYVLIRALARVVRGVP
jgi:hypothetical protein